MTAPLMPKATAVWLVDNTALTFDQIALFCGLHPLEVKGIANGDVAQGIKGMDPISNGQITRAELERCQNDPTAQLQLAERKHDIPEARQPKGARYTPLSKRQERPDAIAWLVRNHPELNDAEIGRLVGTTKPTIQSIRDRSHWNMGNITPVDPVTLGLCKQMELDEYVEKAARREERRRKKAGLDVAPAGDMLKPANETTAIEPTPAFEETPTHSSTDSSAQRNEDTPQADSVFGTPPAEPVNTEEEELRPEDVFKS